MQKILDKRIDDCLFLFLNSIKIGESVSIMDYRLAKPLVEKATGSTMRALRDHLKKLEEKELIKIDKKNNKIELKEKVYAPQRLWDKLMRPDLYRAYVYLLTVWKKPLKNFSKIDMALAFGYTKTSGHDSTIRQKIDAILQSLKDNNIVSYEVQGNYHILTHLEQ